MVNDGSMLYSYVKTYMLKLSFLLTSIFYVFFATTSIVHAENKPQSLLDIYSLALAHDATLASALVANQATQEIIQQAKALYRPVVNFNAGTGLTHTDIAFNTTRVPFPGGAQSFSAYQYGVEARQPIFRQQNLVELEQAKTQVSLADKQMYLTQQTLILRTTSAYFDVLLTQDKSGLLAAQKAAILSQLEQAKANFEAGTNTSTDVNEAQARYDLVVAQELAAINDHQIAQQAIQAITGEMPQSLAVVNTTIKAHALEQSMDKWLEVAALNDLNIQIHQDSVKLSEQAIEYANAGHLPTLDAVASVSDSYASGSYYGFGSDLKSGSVGLQLQLPLYQGGGTTSRVRQALLNKEKAVNDLDIARRQTSQETQRAYLNLNTSIAQVKAFEQALASSQNQLESTHVSYDVGLRTSVDVLNAQQQLFSAKRDLLQARYSYLVNIIRLKTASGVVAESDLVDINQQLVQ